MNKPTINPNQIGRVYSGRPGCACGCRGNYSESKRSVNHVLKLYNQTPEDRIESTQGIGDDGMIYFWDSEDGNRTYSIYLKKGE